ncbi:NADAR domain-containing protein [Balamuthia mandrillaris]
MNARERLKKKIAGKGGALKQARAQDGKQLCVKCKKPTACFLPLISTAACKNCQKEHKELQTISRSAAKKELLATDAVLDELPSSDKPNPYNPKGAPMKTYMRQEVEKAMMRVYGGRKAWKAAVLKAQSKSASSSASSSSSASTPAMKEANPQPKEVSFCSSKDRPYGCFSNSSAHPITLHDKEWPTVEHYLQAQKFAGLPMEEQIRGAISAKEAKSLGSTKEIPKRRDWDRVKDNVLYEAVLAKCRQHKDVSRLLLSTGNAPIHYCSPDDAYWGNAGDGTGRNQLGKTLEIVRGKLRREAEMKAMKKKHSSTGKKKRYRSDDDEEEEEEEENGVEGSEDDEAEYRERQPRKKKLKQQQDNGKAKESKQKEKEQAEKKPTLKEFDISDVL